MMKISKVEYISIVLCVAVLAFGGGWLAHGNNAATPVYVETQYVVETTIPVATTTAQPSIAESSVVEEDVPLVVNINTAGLEELQKLPNIGEKRAQDIIDYRTEYGPFAILEDLTQVGGIGEGILEDIIDYIVIE